MAGFEPLPTISLYPSPAEAELKAQYVGRYLNEVPAPAAVIDVSIAARNCKAMLDAVNELGVEFRAHVKTHKVRSL